jgi:FAD/FMN-containing dehydrogenase
MDRNVAFVRALSSIVGDRHVLVDADQRAGYETDWTGRYSGRCAAVVRPADTAEVARVLEYANVNALHVVAQAGNTGLVGGGVPPADSSAPTIVMSVQRLDAVTDLDASAMQITAGAGVTIAGWQRAARAGGLDTPIDFAARDSATIGGAIATNAGGSRVVRFGTMRQQVVGIEAVMADGTVVGSLAGLPKETVGLHWPSLLAGSEGTLAVITAARLRLVQRFEQVTTMLAALDDVDTALELLAAVRRRVASLDSIEVMSPEAIELVAMHLGTGAPIEVDPDGLVVLVECADHVDPSADLHGALQGIDGIAATAIATGGPPRQRLLDVRDRVTESIAAAATEAGTPTYKLDVAVPVASIGRLLEVARAAAAHDGARLISFGHLAEGNIHLNFLDTRAPDEIAETVLPIVAELGGTISAEHGVGIAKTRWLHLVQRPGDLAARRAIRRALDPNGILNPGVLEPDTRIAMSRVDP